MMKSVQRIVAIWIIIVVPFNLLADSKPEKIYRKVLPSVMTLEVENFAGERFVGSAVLALADDIAITAWHVVSDACSVWAVFADGRRVKVEGCVNIDGKRDLALLKLEKPLPGRRAVLSPRLQAIATRVFVIGAPKGYGFSISDGLVSQLREVDGMTQYQISCPISPGNSGGPLLNERGEVIGITSWTKSDAQNLSFAIPTREIDGLNANGPVIAWQQLALKARPSVAPQTATSKAAVKDDTMHGFDDFAKRLERSTGKRVTVVVQEEGKENTYIFMVPHGAFK
jgi:S1-C subfamily serine protease